MSSNVQIPTIDFEPKVTEVTRRLTAAFENLRLINSTYGIVPDESFIFKQSSFDEFVCRVCDEHYNNIYKKTGVLKTIRVNIKGDFLDAVIQALESNKTSERLKILVGELKKFVINNSNS